MPGEFQRFVTLQRRHDDEEEKSHGTGIAVDRQTFTPPLSTILASMSDFPGDVSMAA
jgi:hypothetical protein